ncbi:hypothetical protein F5B22DRAFT_648559 [Xylaria bambusicola]|uniref:uncharacterized protein n=1 Tax=Xylaria bambusicola TaxID=326684 RepID=UPI0020073D7F|nr:uncharacterized protein F5B22DRAFT_648559 [Xylaria bambusicola]KAI0512455.1 hypothetical protein F5B22DRAFT_648559 [Xylaria bambusicola]
MLYSSLFLLPAFGLLAQASEIDSQFSTPVRRRQVMTCEKTYGAGSLPCGGEESTWCFNPELGQTCCKLDGGFCNAGSYCAPVAGYCCFDDEDLATCAKRAGFDLPSGAANDRVANTDPTAATPARVSRTFTVTPFLTANLGPTSVGTPHSDQEYGTEPLEEAKMGFVTEFTVQIGTACHETLLSSKTPVVTAVVQVANASVSTLNRVTLSASPSTQTHASISPYVQISMAAKKKGALIGSILVIAVAGTLTALL